MWGNVIAAVTAALLGLFMLPHWLAAVFLGSSVFFGLSYWQLHAPLFPLVASGNDANHEPKGDQLEQQNNQAAITKVSSDIEPGPQALDERMLLTMLEALPEAIVVLDRHLNILWVNSSSASLLGIQRSARGQSIRRWLHDPDFASFLQRYLDSPDQSYTEILDSPVYDEEYCQFYLAPMKIGYALLFAYDVTEQIATQKLRMDFVANASHELRTPLTVINGYIESLIDTLTVLPDEKIPKSLLLRPFEDMYSQSNRLMNLTNDLLDLSRVSNKEQKVDEAGIDLKAIIAHVVTEASALSKTHKIELLGLSDARLLANESLAQSIVTNLVFNAVYHTPSETKITVQWFVDDDGQGVFVVRDYGDGIAPQHLSRLTERFFRVDKSHSRHTRADILNANKVSGTGLGLAIVRNAVHTSGGELSIESTLGEGATFSCIWPAEKLLS